MGRSLKKRKLKKYKRTKLARGVSVKSKKTTMKRWEWWLIGGAFVIAIVWLIFLGFKGGLTPTFVEDPTPTPVATTATK